METRVSSKKRKRYSDPFRGTFTRSRSEIFLHRTRSGRARADPSPTRNQDIEIRCPELSRRNPLVSNEEDFDDKDDIARISIKDLRARRVFSPTSISDEKADIREAVVDDSKLEFDVGFCTEDQKNSTNTEISSGGEVIKTQEWFQTTPPGIDVFCKSEQSTDRVLENQSNEKIPSTHCCVDEGVLGTEIANNNKSINNHSNSRTRTLMQERSGNLRGVLVPCSRLKLFKTPSSFSYRRLLPFLMDLAKDDSNALEIRPCQKVGKPVEERPLPSLSASPTQNIILDGANRGLLFGGSDAPPTPKTREMTPPTSSSNDDGPNLESPEQTITEFSIQNPPETPVVSPVYGPTVTEPPNSYGESASKVQQAMLDRSSNLEPAQDAIVSVHDTDLPVKSSCSPPVIAEALPVKEGTFDGCSHLSIKVEEDCTTVVPKLSTDAKPLEALSLCQDSSHSGALVPLEKPVHGPTKGILKRYPRGCRGLCTCLNCASFHLHAERAFEFSRNQMQDAEEVSVALMKELSYLRNLLEKSVDGAECDAVVQVSQVKGVCSKASRAEKLAKSRLMQMRQELNIHCRTASLQRPRVRFADCVETLMPMIETCEEHSLNNETKDSE